MEIRRSTAFACVLNQSKTLQSISKGARGGNLTRFFNHPSGEEVGYGFGVPV
jgi:hypothetical protein